MQHKQKKTRPAVGSQERVGLTTIVNDTALQRAVLTGLSAPLVPLLAALIYLSWRLTA